MTRHLTEQELSAAAAALELPPVARAHLGECAACRRRVAAFVELVAARRDDLAAGAPDWDAQQAAIVARLGATPVVIHPAARRRWLRPLLAAAAVLLVGIAAGLLVPRRAPVNHLTDRTAAQVLADVDATLASSEVPGFEALAPLVPDADELSQLQTKSENAS